MHDKARLLYLTIVAMTLGQSNGSYLIATREPKAEGPSIIPLCDRVSTKSSECQCVTIGARFFCSMPWQMAKGLSENDVSGWQLGADDAVELQEAESLWHMDRLNQGQLPLDGDITRDARFRGEGVTVYVLDNGVDVSHDEFGGRVSKLTSSPGNDAANEHGTHITGLVLSRQFGVANNARGVSIPVFDGQGRGYVRHVIMAIALAVADARVSREAMGRSVAATSLIQLALRSNKNAALDLAVEAAFKEGVLTVAAAGNDGKDACHFSPAGSAFALTVGGSTHDDKPAFFSNYGACVDLWAPAIHIFSTLTNNATGPMSGTSAAAALVTGILAQTLSHSPTLSPSLLKQRLLDSCARNVLVSLPPNSPNRLAQLFSMAPLPSCLPAVEKNGHAYCDPLNPSNYYVCSWGWRTQMTTAPNTKCVQVSDSVVGTDFL
jgi:subtilisin family serine protease